MTTRTERFERNPHDGPNKDGEKADEAEEVVKFSPEEEAALLSQSNSQKSAANDLFSKSEYQKAIEAYEEALKTCPNYLLYEIAVLKSNIAACHLKLQEWKLAVKAATAALNDLDELQGKDKDAGGKDEDVVQNEKLEEEEADEEIISEGAAKAEDTSAKGKREADVERIRVKALLRRAKANSELGGWAALQSAEGDYAVLSKITTLSAADMKVVQTQLRLLPPRTKAAQEKEMGEMMGKLKEASTGGTSQFGNKILNPFGLSTENFQMVKDEKTGGYSMNFNQGQPAGPSDKNKRP